MSGDGACREREGKRETERKTMAVVAETQKEERCLRLKERKAKMKEKIENRKENTQCEE